MIIKRIVLVAAVCICALLTLSVSIDFYHSVNEVNPYPYYVVFLSLLSTVTFFACFVCVYEWE